MSVDLMGVPLKRFEGPIGVALNAYQGIAVDSGLKFDRDSASRIALTPDKPNSARSATDVYFQGERVGILYVIAFKPGDGTGSETNYRLKDLHVEHPYPRKVCVIPRRKTGVYNEAHLVIVRHGIDDTHAEPELYKGTFDLLGLHKDYIRKIGELGYPERLRKNSNLF